MSQTKSEVIEAAASASIAPVKDKGGMENNGFELNEIGIGGPSEATDPKQKDDTQYFNRQMRPGSMYSIRSNMSTTSRASVNCATGRVRCPNLRLKKFYSYREGSFDKAVENIKKEHWKLDLDGNVLGQWHLIEISYWDFHREKVVLLTEKSLLTSTYNFIHNTISDFKRTPLQDLCKVHTGWLKYPDNSVMGTFSYGAVKLNWGKDEDMNVFQRWNPFNYHSVPFILLTSHHILYNDKEKETAIYNADDFVSSLEAVLSKMPNYDKIEMIEGPIEVASYASVASMLYNQNWIGFQLDRNGIDF